VSVAPTMAEARAVIRDMIAALGQSHFAIVPRTLYDDLDATQKPGTRDGTCGIEVRLLEGRVLVTQVRAGSAAAVAGVLPGWNITRIDRTNLDDVLARADESSLDPGEAQFLIARSVGRRLHGSVGQTVSIGFLDGQDRLVERTLTLGQAEGNRVKFGHMPAHYVRFESREIEPGIGYITFNTWFDPVHVMKSLREAVVAFEQTRGIVLDLRGNPGGVGAMAVGAAGLFIDEKDQYLGTMTTRDTQLRFVVNPQVVNYSGPLAVLIDELSASTTEIFAGGMQDLGRARVFGSTSAGAALPSVIERLPNGDGFQYAFADCTTAKGTMLEGHGVVPDQTVKPTRRALLEGRDPVVEAAIRWIQEQASGERTAMNHNRPRTGRPIYRLTLPNPSWRNDMRCETTPTDTDGHNVVPYRRTAKLLTVALTVCWLLPPAALAQEKNLPKGEDLLDKMIQATGGKAAHEKIKNRVTKASFSVPAQGLTGTLLVYEADPNKHRSVLDIANMGKVQRGCDGKNVWEMHPMMGARILEGKEREGLLREVRFQADFHWRELYDKAECVGSEDVKGKPCFKVMLTSSDGSTETWYLDKASHLRVKSENKVSTQMGEVPVETYLSDFKKVDGLTIAHTLTQQAMGMEQVVKVESIEHNVKIPPEKFELPSEIKALMSEKDKPDAEAKTAKE
ncbi:MAG: S41 family peptidase, partial [Phycisphaerae bacterium]